MIDIAHHTPSQYSSVQDYIQDKGMDQPHIWGTEIEMFTLPHLLQTCVFIYNTDDNNWCRYSPHYVDRTLNDDIQQDKNIVSAHSSKKKESTRSYEFYDIDKTEELAAFYTNLTSFDGGSKSSVEAKQISIDVSKYLAFADSRQFIWDNLLNTNRVKQFVEKLQKTAIGPDGLVTKLDRIQTALRYLMRDVPKYKTSDAAMNTIERVGLWKASFGTAKITHTRDKAAREVDTTDDDMQAMKELIHSKIAKTKVETIVNRANPSDKDINFIATYLFICLGYKNVQRAGPAIHMTLKEVAEATYVGEDEDTMLKL